MPTGAGLGGGSSNAATALWAANQFNGFLANEKELQEWSSEIGSDVPFFFSQGAAYCTGRGEVCLFITKIELHLFLIVCPSVYIISDDGSAKIFIIVSTPRKCMEQSIQHVQNNLTHAGAFLYHICACPQNV